MYKVLLVLLLLMGCQTKKEIVNSVDTMQKKSVSTCPDDGVCTIEVLKNKSVHLKYDEFDLPYVDFSESNSTLIKYSYNRNVEENLADANYEEIIYIEINDTSKDFSLKNEELTKVNALFGRLCFCRGATGFYPIREGNLSIIREENNLIIDFNFTIKEVPQVIGTINEKIIF